MLLCRLLIFFKFNFLKKKILSGLPSECQTFWTLIRPDDLLGLIWVQTVCQGYQQTTLVDKEFNIFIIAEITLKLKQFCLAVEKCLQMMQTRDSENQMFV